MHALLPSLLALSLALGLGGCKNTPPRSDPQPVIEVTSAPARRPLPFRRVAFFAHGPDTADDYVAVLGEVAGGGVSAYVTFANREPPDELTIEVAPRALADARSFLTMEQGNAHMVEKETLLDASVRTIRIQSTSLPFLPSRRIVDESRAGRIGALRVGDSPELPSLLRAGAARIDVSLRGAKHSVDVDRFVVPKEAWPDEGELLLAHDLPTFGAVDVVLSLQTSGHHLVVQSID